MIKPLQPLLGASNLCRQCLLRLRKQSTSSTTTVHNGSQLIIRRPLSNVSGMKADDNAQNMPRWAATPSAMQAPYRIRPKGENDVFPVNEDPEKLNSVYVRMFGPGGEQWLDEDVRWLAVTHKSFDHGRRGYNERLAFMGKRMVELQTSLRLLDRPISEAKVEAQKQKDPYGRSPFADPSLEGIQNLSVYEKKQLLDERRLSQLGQRYGLADVVRWKPKQVRDLKASGLDGVVATTVYAVIGALALQKGGAVANDFVRQRILSPLGVR